MRFDFADGRLEPERRPVGPVRRHGLDNIGDRQYFGAAQALIAV